MSDIWATPQPGAQPPGPATPWPPGPDQWQQPPTPQARLTPWGVVALVTGILALVPLAIGAGTVALVQTAREGTRGFGLAVAGLAAAAFWSLLALGAVVAFLLVPGGAFTADPLGTVADAGSVRVGACLEAPAGDLTRYVVTSCAGRHEAEVFAVQPLGGAAAGWLGAGEARTRADDYCYGAFAPYVGESYDSSDYDYGYFVPDRDEWGRGEHRVVCVVLSLDEGDSLPSTVRSGEPA